MSIDISQSLLEQKEKSSVFMDIENFDLNQEIEITNQAFAKIYSYYVLVKIYVQDNTTLRNKDGSVIKGLVGAGSGFNPNMYQAASGVILKMGKKAFTGEFCEGEDELPQIGDWVLLPDGYGIKRYYKGMPYLVIEDYHIFRAKTNNPHLFIK